MNFIHTTEGGFDAALSIEDCIPGTIKQTESELIDKIFNGDILLGKLHGIECNLNQKLLNKFEDRCDANYDILQDTHKEYLRDECGYPSTEGVDDGYEEFCREYYAEETPKYQMPLFSKIA